MRRLLDAVRGRKQPRSEEEIDYSELPPPTLPLLPAQRPRPITPPATTATPATADILVAALGTFALLSPELRRRVLVAAFGERTLHLDLRPAPRGQQPSPSTAHGVAHEHGRGAAPLSWSRIVAAPAVTGETPPTTALSPSESYKTRKKTGPEWEWEWRWYGCVCHRVIPRGSPVDGFIRARGRDPYVWPHRDGCLEGDAMMCELWPRGPAVDGMAFPERGTCDCAVAALGWLRACRQAYVEGVEVLYSTNTFFIQSRDSLEALLCPPNDGRRLFLPHRLAQIRSLELRCEFLLFGDFTLPFIARASDKERMRLLPDLASLAVSFPNLRSLVVTFPNILDNERHADPDARLPEIDRLLLRPLALAFAHLAPQQEKHIVVELPSNVFRDIRGIGHRKGLGLEQEQRGEEWGDGRGLWLRTFILTDILNEPDDQMSVVRYLTYSNEFDTKGLVATTSVSLPNETHPEAIELIIRAYAGSDPLFVSIWGGANTLAQALQFIRTERTPKEAAELRSRLRVYSISDQDDAGPWVRVKWPDITYIVNVHGFREYQSSTWAGIGSADNGAANVTKVQDDWLTPNIRIGPLGEVYPKILYGMEGDSPSFMWLIQNGLNSARRPDWGSWGGRYTRVTEAEDINEYGTSMDTAVSVTGMDHQSQYATVWRWRDAYQDDFAARMQWGVTDKFEDATHPPNINVNGSISLDAMEIFVPYKGSVVLDASDTYDPDHPEDSTHLEFECPIVLD
ncbi:hypothetical protein K4K58_012357 [Colletotrichum sp. SAR11_239]|nr:hypothetical protein K4K58_012357 [Colletotrichum sp. SAR11_239]